MNQFSDLPYYSWEYEYSGYYVGSSVRNAIYGWALRLHTEVIR